MSVVVLVPVLNRPERVQAIVNTVRESVPPEDGGATCWLLRNEDDVAEREAIERIQGGGFLHYTVPWPSGGRGDYARKMNTGLAEAIRQGETWVFLGADDLTFHPGWFEACMTVWEATGACVLGTNDLGNPNTRRGTHSTHTLVHRDYAKCGTIDDPTRLLHEGYWHNWVDNELVETAKARGTFAHATGAVVEHLHHFWKDDKGQPKSADDATYQLGRVHYHEDRRLFERRRRLWT